MDHLTLGNSHEGPGPGDQRQHGTRGLERKQNSNDRAGRRDAYGCWHAGDSGKAGNSQHQLL
eukprot:1099142-Rhodomonas_salina.1